MKTVSYSSRMSNGIINSQYKNIAIKQEYDQEKVNINGQREGELIHNAYDDTIRIRSGNLFFKEADKVQFADLFLK